ncbi:MULTISPECIES: enoyl-CoA hydratase/isomerase family protein [Kocuria]|uniref:enoyl-CoA hydratase/isomerase family protein n=1 Tax=Kocuria TaxID=57493 RepID=UPI0006D7B41E|nr:MULTISPECIES: enoyl-CoA hydratase-related protein [Kocuria]MDN5632053.1 enoyl-CoA hydratase-related protein [Kocuria sp.]
MSPDPSDVLTVEVADGIALVTVNRPEVRNAINATVLQALTRTLEELAADDAVQVLIFTGAGDKAFVAGADINELAVRTPRDGLKATMQGVYEKVEQFPKPTIAAVNGYAFGGGHELALACDIRVASTNAQFALPETGLGIMPAAGGTQRLAKLVGLGRATEIILTGRRVKADDALAMGLVTNVVEPEQLLETARETANAIMAKGPLAIQLAKTVVRHGFDVDHQTGILLERLAQSVLYSSAEKAEGTNAFLEKRSPDFQGAAQKEVNK